MSEERKINGINEFLQISITNNMPLSVNEKRQIFELIINLQTQLQQKENIIKGLDNTIENLEEVVEHKDNIIKEVREYIEKNYDDYEEFIYGKDFKEKILEILDKDIPKKSDYNYEKVEENKE